MARGMKTPHVEASEAVAAMNRRLEYEELEAYPRPKTRGELRDKLREGRACEVVASNASITRHMLAWLGLWDGKDYTIRPSENRGWSVFAPVCGL